jgi:hypothetical protein
MMGLPQASMHWREAAHDQITKAILIDAAMDREQPDRSPQVRIAWLIEPRSHVVEHGGEHARILRI